MSYERSEVYAYLMEKVISDHPEDFDFIRQYGVAVDVLRSDKSKVSNGKPVLGECVKANEMYGPYCPYNYIIIIYDANCSELTDRQMYVLMYHELLHIQVEEAPVGFKCKIRPHDAEEFRAVIRRYGIDWAEPGALLPPEDEQEEADDEAEEWEEDDET